MRPGAGELARLAAACGALVLALTSQGDALVLGALLAVAAWRPLLGVALPGACLLVSWRWGSTSLADWAGAQDVLGAGGWTGPSRAATGLWLAAAALALGAPVPGLRTVVTTLVDGQRVATVEAPRRTLAATVGAAAAGLAAGLVVAGPALGERPLVRVAGAVGGLLLALAARRLRLRSPRAADGAVALLVAAAAVAVVPGAPGWSGTVDGAAAGRGLLVAVAAALAVLVALAAQRAMGTKRPSRLASSG